MATIVEYTKKGDYQGKRYVLLGAGYGMFKSARANMILGDLFPTETEGSQSKLAVCDENGKVLWGNSDDLVVVSVDGQSPADALAALK
ncbi:MAG: hypothetical protein ACYTGW_22390 [Planctomycetota bacterium]|jgi:hypothetical protein